MKHLTTFQLFRYVGILSMCMGVVGCRTTMPHTPTAQGVYVLDGVDHDLDFGTSGVAGNTMIVFPCGKKGNYFIYEFSQRAFYDTPECHQYT